jgi:hypothetical protein
MLTVDDLVRLLHDYCGEDDIPSTSRATAIRYNPSSKAIEIKIESPDIPTSSSNHVIQAKFDLRRTWGIA